MNRLPILYVVIPCYNEEAVLNLTAPLFKDELELLIGKEKISKDSKIMFVNDGSKDRTWEIICELSKKDSCFIGISQSRNRGHQSSVLAGLMEAKDKCDITISIDCDGQDDISVMEKMVDEYMSGAEIVYGVRKERKTDTFLKRATALAFYKIMKLMGVDSVYNHADYRLVSSRALNEFANFKEVNLFLRGMFPLVGFKSSVVEYDRTKRLSGKTHYSPSKMFELAIDGITSLSIKPIRIITVFAFLVALLSIIGIIWSVAVWASGETVSGWASLTCIICFVSGVQILSLGVVGEYIGKIYLEVKKRPRYIISDRTEDDE